MDGTGPQHSLNDSQLDRELESALGVEPSPEFLARVRTRIAAEPEMSVWRLAIWRRGVQPGLVMALAAVVLAVVVPSVMRNVKEPMPSRTMVTKNLVVPVPERVQALAPAETPKSAAADASVSAEGAATLVLEGVAAPPVPLQLSQPLFSDDERRAIFQFAVAVEEGRLPPVPAVAEVEEQFSVARKLIIEPLMIDPLPQLARVQKQGEGQW